MFLQRTESKPFELETTSIVGRKKTLRLIINREKKNIDSVSTLNQLLSFLKLDPQGIAVALNDAIITKDTWNTCPLKENDHITILTAVQGG